MYTTISAGIERSLLEFEDKVITVPIDGLSNPVAMVCTLEYDTTESGNKTLEPVFLPQANSSRSWLFANQESHEMTGEFVEIDFGFESFEIIICNDDSTSALDFSWDGINIHGKIPRGSNLTLHQRRRKIFLKMTASSNYRIFVQ